jgi:hypothetical protein
MDPKEFIKISQLKIDAAFAEVESKSFATVAITATIGVLVQRAKKNGIGREELLAAVDKSWYKLFPEDYHD